MRHHHLGHFAGILDMTQESENGTSQGSNSAVEPGVHFTEADFQAIAKELGVDCTPGLKNQLITSVKNYFSSTEYWESRESTAEVRAALIKVSKQSKKLVESLENLSPLAQALFKQKLPNFEATIGDIRKLQEAGENEVQHLKFGKGGPTKNVPLILNLMMLAAIYHEHTGKTPGISTDPYKESFGGPFFRFVIIWLKAVEPDLVASEKYEQKIGKLVKNHLNLIKSLAK